MAHAHDAVRVRGYADVAVLPRTPASVLALNSLETHRLSAALSLLLSPLAQQDAHRWRNDVAHQLCQLVGADNAVLVVERADGMRIHALHVDPAAIRAYQAHYVSVDFGLDRLRTLGVEVWCRQMLWDSDGLARSEYYNDFAVPNRLHGTVGLSVAVPTLEGTMRVALFHNRAVSDLSATHRQLQVLALLLPAFTTGASAHLRWSLWQGRLTAMLDDIDEAAALCDVSGRVVHENGALAQLLRGARGALVRETMGAVSRSVFAAVALGRVDEPIVRRVSAGTIGYDVRGTALDSALGELPMTLLVTVAPHRPNPIILGDLRTRYNLTSRELEVADLLRRRRSNAEIAGILAISEHTARRHTENVLLKLGVHSRNDVEVVLRALPNADRARRPPSPATGQPLSEATVSPLASSR